MTFCFAAQSLAQSAAAMAGVRPITSPPVVLASFDPKAMAGHTLIFFKLHGVDKQPYWYGDNNFTACSAEQLANAPIANALVFAANCFGGAESPMVQALLAAGAQCVITGTGPNIAGVRWLDGADVIGFVWRYFIQAGCGASFALRLGKIAAKAKRPGLARDVDSFQLVGQANARLKRS